MPILNTSIAIKREKLISVQYPGFALPKYTEETPQHDEMNISPLPDDFRLCVLSLQNKNDVITWTCILLAHISNSVFHLVFNMICFKVSQERMMTIT